MSKQKFLESPQGKEMTLRQEELSEEPEEKITSEEVSTKEEAKKDIKKVEKPGEPAKSVSPEEAATVKEKARKQIGPLILIVVAVLLILVSAVFVSITYYQVQKAKTIASKLTLPKTDSTYLLTSLIIIWITFIVSLILLGSNYFNYKNLQAKDDTIKIPNSLFLWISLIIAAILTMAVGLLCLFLSFKFKALSNALFTNILVAAVAALGGFIFIVIAAVFYGYNDSGLRSVYESAKDKRSKYLERRKEKKMTTTTTKKE